jgi:hypothetical protein
MPKVKEFYRFKLLKSTERSETIILGILGTLGILGILGISLNTSNFTIKYILPHNIQK